MTLEVCLQSSINMGWCMSTDRSYYILGVDYSKTGTISALAIGKRVVYIRIGDCIKLFGVTFTLPFQG